MGTSKAASNQVSMATSRSSTNPGRQQTRVHSRTPDPAAIPALIPSPDGSCGGMGRFWRQRHPAMHRHQGSAVGGGGEGEGVVQRSAEVQFSSGLRKHHSGDGTRCRSMNVVWLQVPQLSRSVWSRTRRHQL